MAAGDLSSPVHSELAARPASLAIVAQDRPYWQSITRSLGDSNTYLDAGVHLALILLICVAASLLGRLVRAGVRRAVRRLLLLDARGDHSGRAAYHKTLAGVVSSILRYLIYFVAFILILGTWNIHALGLMGTALGTAGILGVVVGFGAQKLVRDVITGTFILLEGQYFVGDTVTIGAVTGVVEDVGVRVTRIRDEVGRLNLIPNGDIGQVTNHSRGRLDAAVEIGVPFDQDLQALKKAVDAASAKVLAEESGPVVGPASVQGMTAMDGAKVTLRVVATAAPGQQKAAEMALRSALRDEFLSAAIKPV